MKIRRARRAAMGAAGFLVFACQGQATQQIPLSGSMPPPLTPHRQPHRDFQHSFELRHGVHVSTTNRSIPTLYRDYSETDRAEASVLSGQPVAGNVLRTKKEKTWRPSSRDAYQAARRASFHRSRAFRSSRLPSVEEMEDISLGETLGWGEEEIDTPDVQDLETLVALAKMTANAYALPGADNWYDLDGKYNLSDSFGWLEDGIRGHVFANPDNSTIVVSIKDTDLEGLVFVATSTSPYYVGGKSPTKKKDTTNDNLFFSCCCARLDWSWTPVCDCYDGSYTCKQDCIEEAVMLESAYYPIATDLYNNITALYPDSQVWLVGHSLGGALASLLGLTYGVPSVAFESPGDHLPATRLHLPMPPGLTYSSSKTTTHVYHNGDPIPLGACTGRTSVCEIANLALESRCHTGQTILYDSVGVLGTTVDARWHRITWVIENLLVEGWDLPNKVAGVAEKRAQKVRGWGWWPGGRSKKGDEDEGEDSPPISLGIPEPEPESDCFDCFRWEYV